MLVDCGDCVMRDRACGDCVVSVLLGVPEPASHAPASRPVAVDHGHSGMPLQQDERDAMAALADGGLIPHLRLVNRNESDSTPDRVAAPRKARVRRIG